MRNKFKQGEVVIWEPKNFNPDFWNKFPEEDRIKYYSRFGYGSNKLKLFVFLCEILDAETNDDSGHCVLIDMDTQEIITMAHTSEFRKATDMEF
jgi:hypothetical protein